MKHIAMVAQPIQRIPPVGAAAVEWWMWQVSKHLASSGEYIPHIICTGEGDPSPEYEVREGVHFYRITLSKLYKRLFHKWTRLDPYGYARRAALYCRKINAAIIHTHNSPTLHQQIARYTQGSKMILHMHNEKITSSHFHADLILTVSDYLAKWYAQRLPHENIRIITNGIDRHKYTEEAALPDWRTNFPKDKKILMYAGRISPEKGVHLLAEAFTHLAPRHPELQLVIIGGRSEGNNDRARYADKVEASLKPFSNQVTFLGSVSPSEMHLHYRAADLLVVPSVFEAFGMVCLEGMAAGVPVLAAPKGGLPEFVRDGKNGYLIRDYGKTFPLALQIKTILKNADAAKEIAAAGQIYALNNHDWSLVATELAKIYDQILSNDVA